jgi:hypothetical protein
MTIHCENASVDVKRTTMTEEKINLNFKIRAVVPCLNEARKRKHNLASKCKNRRALYHAGKKGASFRNLRSHSVAAKAQSQLLLQFEPTPMGQTDCPPLTLACDPAKFEKTPKKKCPERSSNVMPTLCPIKTCSRKSPSCRPAGVQPELLQPLRSFLGEYVFFSTKGSPEAHPLCGLVKFHCDATGKMHVTTASKPERLCLSRLAIERCGHWSNNGQGFDQRSDFRAGQPVITMFPLWLDDEQSSIDQLRQVCARSLGRDSSHKRQLACRECPSVHQSNKHSGPRIIADQRAYSRDLKFHVSIVFKGSKKTFRSLTNCCAAHVW